MKHFHATPRRPRAYFAVVLALTFGCGGDPQTPPPAAAPEAASRPPFVDRAAELGLDFVHFNGMSGQFYIAEALGSGGALADFDSDGDLDLFLVQGAELGPREAIQTGARERDHRLYLNRLRESGALRFEDVTATARIPPSAYGMGAAVGDFDRDGDPDLYVTSLGPNLFLRNDGGHFTDITDATGTAVSSFSSSATFVDYDRDGYLDLFVANYVDFSFGNHKVCRAETGAADYCSPLAFPPLPARLFRNRRNGTFEDVTTPSQIGRARGNGLGVIAADLNADDKVDLYVANDASPNFLWINEGDGTFREDALLAGCALNEAGEAEASMGLDAGDYDDDGDLDLFMTHLTGETNTLYANDGRGLFNDMTAESGLGPPSLPFTGFGTGWFDVENDGRLDLIVVNGAVRIIAELARAGDPYPLSQTNQLFSNQGAGRFQDVTHSAGPAFLLREVSRAAIFGDLDDDGDTDVIVTHNNGPVRALINEVGQDNPWLGLRIVEADGRIDAIGSTVEVLRRDGRRLTRRVHVDGSYLAANDPRVLIGLAGTDGVRSVRVRFPDGAIEEWTELPTGRYVTLRRGSGRTVED